MILTCFPYVVEIKEHLPSQNINPHHHYHKYKKVYVPVIMFQIGGISCFLLDSKFTNRLSLNVYIIYYKHLYFIILLIVCVWVSVCPPSRPLGSSFPRAIYLPITSRFLASAMQAVLLDSPFTAYAHFYQSLLFRALHQSRFLPNANVKQIPHLIWDFKFNPLHGMAGQLQ
jgi:hypothetical protein